ncbi:nucleotidyltransferase family protein [Ramlibacter sp.]|uniref:nucleotidyltransferase family protein n=1 Tax=Ramlibacter sp. TaxID=1917967 RepID=UPI002B5903EE|nr:NTP transferase domain-containing protein [Ramlibacter sp.]HWI83298.1 NTP transferase domain-containing protein [Ramlibacter sp.]
MSQPVVLVLASGRGERFTASGGAGSKLQALLAGVPVLERTLDAVRASGLPWHLEQAPHAGMGDSIAAAVRATARAGGWLVLPGDLPLVQPRSLQRVAAALAGHAVVVPQFHGRRGHPVGFAPECGAALAALAGESGAAAIVRRYAAAGAALLLDIDDPGLVTDIDTVDDLARAEQALRALSPSR